MKRKGVVIGTVGLLVVLLLVSGVPVRATTGDDGGGCDRIVQVIKYTDLGMMGEWDDADEPIPGWTVYLDGVPKQTNEYGQATFLNVGPGVHWVTEEQDENLAYAYFLPGMIKVVYPVEVTIDSCQFVIVKLGNAPQPPPPPSPGTGTPGYWKNHPDAWPVEAITIGGVTYSKADAIGWLKTNNKHDKTITMFRALVAAKLNVLIGNEDSCITGTIAAADAWMAADGPVGSKVRANSDAWQTGEWMYEALDAYNNGELCAPARD